MHNVIGKGFTQININQLQITRIRNQGRSQTFGLEGGKKGAIENIFIINFLIY